MGQKAKKALSNQGIKASIIKIDASKNQEGCQYGIQFNERDYFTVISTLRERGIEYGTYRAT
jgi:hypothetical protein